MKRRHAASAVLRIVALLAVLASVRTATGDVPHARPNAGAVRTSRGQPLEAREAFERVRQADPAAASAMAASLRGVPLVVDYREPATLADGASDAERRANVVEAITEISSAMRTADGPSSTIRFEHMLDGMPPRFDDPALQARVAIVQDYVDHSVQIRAAGEASPEQRANVQRLDRALAYRRLQFARYHFRLPASRADNEAGLRVVASSALIGGVAQGVQAVG